jgi:hypothetical protein
MNGCADEPLCPTYLRVYVAVHRRPNPDLAPVVIEPGVYVVRVCLSPRGNVELACSFDLDPYTQMELGAVPDGDRAKWHDVGSWGEEKGGAWDSGQNRPIVEA